MKSMKNISIFFLLSLFILSCSNDGSFHTAGQARLSNLQKQETASLPETQSTPTVETPHAASPITTEASPAPSVETVPLLRLEISPSTANLVIDGTQQFSASLIGNEGKQDVTGKVKWNAIDTSGIDVADLTGQEPGVIKAAAVGSAKISAELDGMVGEASLVVTSVPVLLSIKIISTGPSSVSIGDSSDFTVVGKFSDGTEKNISSNVNWTSSKPAITSISPGETGAAKVTAVSPGTATITATTNGVSAGVDLTVAPPQLVSLEISPLKPSIPTNSSQQFSVQGVYQDGSKTDLTAFAKWSSLNKDIADVANEGTVSGLVKSLKAGVAEIQAEYNNVSSKATLTVTPATLVSIAISTSPGSLDVGQTQSFHATGRYSDNSTHDLSADVDWLSSSTGVATISNDQGSTKGLLTATGAGTSQITATLRGVTSQPAAVVVKALPAATKFKLSVTKSGAGSGSISGTGISCGSDCEESVDQNASVVLTATPAAGSTFSGWSGACVNATGTCTVKLTAAATVNAQFSSASVPVTDVIEIADGLAGGHMDVDTATRSYPVNQGQTTQHVHEFDKKYNVTGVNFFSMFDARFNEIQKAIPGATPFVIVIRNAALSKGAVLQTNGKNVMAVDYQAKASSAKAPGDDGLTIYSMTGNTAGTTKLTSLKLLFAKDVLTTSGLVPSEPDCVIKNKPGKGGEYRGGALAIQAIAVDSTFVPATPGSGKLLWEGIIFWHKDNHCW